MGMVKLQIYNDDGRVDHVDVPADFGLMELLQEYLNEQNRPYLDAHGQPLPWRLEDRQTGTMLRLEQTIEQNGIRTGQALNLVLVQDKHQEQHIRCQKCNGDNLSEAPFCSHCGAALKTSVDIKLEIVAPDGKSHHAELPPDTRTHEFQANLIERFALPKADKWFLFDPNTNRSLDSQKTLAENNVASGQRLMLRSQNGEHRREDRDSLGEHGIRCQRCNRENLAGAAFCSHCGAPLDKLPDFKLEVVAHDGKNHHAELPPDTQTQEFLTDLVGVFGLPSNENWELFDATRGRSLDPHRTLSGNGVISGQRLSLRRKPKRTPPPVDILAIARREWKKIAIVLALIALAIVAFKLTGRPSVSVSVEPTGPLTLSPSQTQAFIATVEHGRTNAVSWSLDPEVGSVSPEGVYMAPASISTTQAVKVVARSQDDATKTASALVTLVPLAIRIDPPRKTLGPNQSTQFSVESAKFSVEQAEDLGTAVEWSLDPGVGTITQDGVYTAPASIPAPRDVTVIAASKAEPTNSARATISLTQSPVVQVTLSPRRISLGASESHQFAVGVSPNPGGVILWSLNPAIGNVSQQGLYTAPGVISAARQVQVVAVLSTDSSATAAASVILQPVGVGPISATLDGDRVVLHATVTHAANTNLTWSINPPIGSISSQGVYTPPASVPNDTKITAIATSQADTTKSSQFVINITPKVTITLNPYQTVMTSSQQQTLSATVTGTQNKTVTWGISGPGSILPSGLYTAPSTVPPGGESVQINVTSNADPTKHATGSFRLVANTAAPQRVRVSQGVAEGNLIHQVSPTYPPTARSAGIQGTVVLKAVIGKDGLVHDLQVVSGQPALTNSALAAVKQWRYQPYRLDGEAVEVETTIIVNFTLHN